MTPNPAADPLPAELPPVVRAMIDHPIVQRRSWRSTIAPAYLGVFIWVPFLDALGRAGGGSPWAILGAWLAVLAGAGLLYLFPARLGWSSGERLPIVAARVLGVEGAEWIAGVLHGLFGLVWTALAIVFSVRLTLLGLVALDLLDAAELGTRSVGGLTLESPLFLVAAGFWTLIIASANGLRLAGVIATLMKVYAPVAFLLLVLIALWNDSHAPQAGAESASALAWGPIAARACQLVFGYFAFAGLLGVEWGASVRDRRDVALGGGLGILAGGLAAVVAAIVLGASDPGASASAVLDERTPPGSFAGALFRGLGASAGPWTAGAALLLFGLAALAPACYGASLFTTRFRNHWPALRGWGGVGVFYALVLSMAATGLDARSETLFAVSGALFAPLAGILTAAACRPGVRASAGRRRAGVAAWAVGVVVGLLPVLGAWAGVSWLAAIQPASLYAYLAGLVVSLATAATDRAGRSGDAG